ncbi:hypothetical protein BDQ17DRAFT_1428484 [Cyathus striatus]|nr:hypothetical protein BDQ17DRAFT_1428484 [Cyathus striatus]
MQLKVTHPESELKAACDFERNCVNSKAASRVDTSIDILEVVHGGTPGEGISRWRENLGHKGIVEYIESVQNIDSKPALTVFFLKSRYRGDVKSDLYAILANPQTMIKLQHAYNILPIFIYRTSYKSYTPVQQHCFTNYDDDGKLSQVETLHAKQHCARYTLNWYRDFEKRLDIQINLAFNLRFQRDSETNVQIAKDTAKIAQDAQRDSSSMIMCVLWF